MKKTLLFVLILSGLSSLSTVAIKDYHFVKILKTWREAQRYCRETFIELATVHNQDDHDRLLSVLQGGGEHVWIGLHDDLTRWRWSNGRPDFNNNTDFSNWGPNLPLSKDRKRSCGTMDTQGFWQSSMCLETHPAVCYYEKGPSKYILVETELGWFNATAYCRSNYTDLVRVHNISENNEISSLLTKTSWIGLIRKNWGHWSDQTPTTFTKWDSSQPDSKGKSVGECALVNTTTGTWWDDDCEEKHYFACEKLQHKSTFKLKFQSDADLNDPAVQQQILEQLHAKLKTHGLPDYKLRWKETDGQTFHKEKKCEEESSC